MPLISNCSMMPAWHQLVSMSGHVEESETARKLQLYATSIYQVHSFVCQLDYITCTPEPFSFKEWFVATHSADFLIVLLCSTCILPFPNTSAPARLRLRLAVPHVSTKTTKIITEFTSKDPFLHLKRAN